MAMGITRTSTQEVTGKMMAQGVLIRPVRDV